MSTKAHDEGKPSRWMKSCEQLDVDGKATGSYVSEVLKYGCGRADGPQISLIGGRGGFRVIVLRAPNMTLGCPAIGGKEVFTPSQG